MYNIKFPKDIKDQINKSFIITLKDELDKIFSKELDNLKDTLNKEPTFYNFYDWFSNSNGFNKALKMTCKKHKLMKLYTYRKSMDLDDNEVLGDIIMNMLYEYDVVKKGDIHNSMPCPFLK